MDTLMSAVQSAEKAVMGTDTETGSEPISGLKGAGTASEPFDLGNSEKANTAGKSQIPENTGVSGPSPGGISGTTGADTQPSTGQGSHFSTESSKPSTAEKIGKTDSGLRGQQGDVEGDKITPVTAASNENATPASGTGTGRTQRGSEAAAGNKGGKVHPQPEEDISPKATSNKEEEATDQAKESKGTGERYVKSTGFAAEGGDFDAEKPGAGKEAERLREHGGGNPNGAKNGGPDLQDANHHSEKGGGHHPHFSKMKERLHIGKHHA